MLITIIIGIMVFAIVLANMLDTPEVQELEQRIAQLERFESQHACGICAEEDVDLRDGLCDLCATRQRLMSLYVRPA